MKTVCTVFVVATALLAPAGLLAQAYSIDWYKVAAGGGTSTGGVYSLSATSGQHDAGGPMTGGQFALSGGFWSVVGAFQTPGAPFLSVSLTPTNTVVVSWPAPAPGWTLEFTTALVSPPGTNVWTDIPPPYPTGGTNLYHIELAPVGSKFYRLFKP